jgi:hypothetical protein
MNALQTAHNLSDYISPLPVWVESSQPFLSLHGAQVCLAAPNHEMEVFIEVMQAKPTSPERGTISASVVRATTNNQPWRRMDTNSPIPCSSIGKWQRFLTKEAGEAILKQKNEFPKSIPQLTFNSDQVFLDHS